MKNVCFGFFAGALLAQAATYQIQARYPLRFPPFHQTTKSRRCCSLGIWFALRRCGPLRAYILQKQIRAKEILHG